MARPRRNQALFYLLSLVLALALFALTGETAVRLLAPQQEPTRWLGSDPRYGQRNEPGFVQLYRYAGSEFVMRVETNRWGHRAPPYPPGAFSDPAVTRILLLGDSFVFGYGVAVEERFDTRLARRLESAGLEPLMINAGVGGWGTLQQVLYAKDHLREFDPDVVILTFCGNDPEDDARFSAGASRDGDPAALPVRRFLRRHSHLYRLLHQSLKIVRAQRRIDRRLLAAGDGARAGRFVDEHSGSVIDERDWQRTREALADLRDAYLGFNPRGLLLIQATTPWSREIRAALSAIADGRRVHYVDHYAATVGLDEAARRTPHDAHWSPLVHELVAEGLAERLLRLLESREACLTMP